ncbi:type II secretion system F family protein [Noviherbaspirillum galbum]|uniref:Pilus assembly protein n=1 Tax=Noviherbaspirillum galbum TaxID=2709383 RepID=A0A6B3SVQ1_9BURK|nr:type II secretion system F family protein [Noviherbaspirillum galbum]NEX62452.1 pilus assembly protein [Noviherbaspirillum galbum]
MNASFLLLAASIAAFVSVGMLAWLAATSGTAAMARYRDAFTERASFQVREFFLFIDPRALFITNLCIMALGGIAAWTATGSGVAAMAAVCMLALLPRLLYARMRHRRRLRFDEQLPDALLMLAGSMRAGVGLNAALAQLVAEASVPLRQEFSLLLREQRLGVTIEQSLANLSRRMSTESTALVVSAMRIAVETGGGLAETLERTSQSLRGRLQMEAKIRALTAQGKLQAWVVGMLPLGLMAALDKMEPEAMSHLWHTRVGWATLAVIALLEVAGIHVIRKIVAIDV